MSASANPIGVITGASIGIGRALAVSLAGHGYNLALIARSESGLAETLQQVKSAGGEGRAYRTDLRDTTQLMELTSSILSEMGTPHLIANVAGVWHDDEIAFQGPNVYETPIGQIENVMDVGLRAPMILTASLLPPMVEQRAGHVINISGTFSDGAKGWLHYYVSKKALEEFTIGLAQEVRDHEIQVNCVSPADVATEPYIKFYPEYAASALRPEEVAEFIVTLLGPSCRHITGQIIEIRNRDDHE